MIIIAMTIRVIDGADEDDCWSQVLILDFVDATIPTRCEIKSICQQHHATGQQPKMKVMNSANYNSMG